MTLNHPSVSAKAIIERFLLFWLILAAAVAYRWPVWFPGVADPFEASEPWKKQVFALTMLAIGSLLPCREVHDVLRRWPKVLGGTAIQYISMPLLAYGCGRLFALDEVWMAGIIMVGCVPGAMASNVLTLAARGNVSYSVSLTTSATLISPLVVPFTLWLALSHWFKLDPVKMSLTLCWMVVLPVVVGHLLSRRFALWRAVADRFAATVANLTILWIIAMVIGVNRDQLQLFHWQVVAGGIRLRPFSARRIRPLRGARAAGATAG